MAEITFPSLVGIGGAYLGNRRRRGLISVRRPVGSVRFFENVLAREVSSAGGREAGRVFLKKRLG